MELETWARFGAIALHLFLHFFNPLFVFGALIGREHRQDAFPLMIADSVELGLLLRTSIVIAAA